MFLPNRKTTQLQSHEPEQQHGALGRAPPVLRKNPAAQAEQKHKALLCQEGKLTRWSGSYLGTAFAFSKGLTSEDSILTVPLKKQ